MKKKSVKGLIEYVTEQVGRPYWFGTTGQIATEELYRTMKKNHPQYYTATDFSSQYGQKVHDCSGLVDAYLMTDDESGKRSYEGRLDYSANGLYASCEEKGDIRTIPELPGVCVFFPDHMGVYVGDGYVVEARGHKYGVVKSRLQDRPWKYWGKHPDIDYTQEYDEYIEVRLPVLTKGTKTADVGILQTLLLYHGYSVGDCGIDCSFGGATQKAVKALQVDQKLELTGICGQKEWECLLKGDL